MSQIFLNDLISQISTALDMVESGLVGCTGFHSKRVAALVLKMGACLGYDDTRLFGLGGCALLHDNALTEYILSEQPGEQQELNLKTHCIIGQNNGHFFPFPGSIEGFILFHHECADGSGPFGKAAGEYPEEAAFIALADQIDVRFTLKNPEKLDDIRSYLTKWRGTRYDCLAVDTALTVFTPELIESFQDDKISDTVKSLFPEVLNDLTNQEMVRLSEIIARIIDYKSAFTQEHSIQIANKAWYMGKVYQYSEYECSKLYLAAALHDIGKLLIPDEVLEKPGRLTDDEFTIIKNHVKFTWDILHPIRGFETIAMWATNHHEKLDGSGYPFGKTASALDFNSRLLACLDIYQAVREARPYHPARSHEDTMAILQEMAKKGFVDSQITEDLNLHLAALPDGYAKSPEVSA